MTSEEAAYVGGIIDGEGWLEYVRKDRIHHDRKHKPVYKTLYVRMEVPQVDGRLIDFLMKVTQEGTRSMKRYPKQKTWQDQHRWRVGYHGVYRILKQVYPYLIVKKQKAKLIVDHYDKQFLKKDFGKGKFGQ